MISRQFIKIFKIQAATEARITTARRIMQEIPLALMAITTTGASDKATTTAPVATTEEGPGWKYLIENVLT